MAKIMRQSRTKNSGEDGDVAGATKGESSAKNRRFASCVRIPKADIFRLDSSAIPPSGIPPPH